MVKYIFALSHDVIHIFFGLFVWVRKGSVLVWYKAPPRWCLMEISGSNRRLNQFAEGSIYNDNCPYHHDVWYKIDKQQLIEHEKEIACVIE